MDVDATPSQASGLTAEIRNTAGWVVLPLRQTVFGLGAVAAVLPGTLEVRLASTTGANPDLALTVVDSRGGVVAQSRARLALVPVTSPETPVPSPSPSPSPSPGVTPAPGSTSAPALTPGITPVPTPSSAAQAVVAPTPSSSATPSAPAAASAHQALAKTGVSLNIMLIAMTLLGAGFATIAVRRRLRGNR